MYLIIFGLTFVLLGILNLFLHGSVQVGLIIFGSVFLAIAIILFFNKKRALYSTSGNTKLKSDSKRYKTKIDEYQKFIANVYICSEHKRSATNTTTVCITKDTKELFFFKSKFIGNRGLYGIYCFSCAPKKITTYRQLMQYLDDNAKAFYNDLSEDNWRKYFEFMFPDADISGDIIKKRLLCCDTHVVLNVSRAILRLALETPEKRKELLKPSFESLSSIKENAQNIYLGGAFASNSRFLSRAIKIIEGNESNECFCNLTLDEFGGNANSIAEIYGFTLVQPSKSTYNSYVTSGKIECPVCHKKYEVCEEYTGWHIPTRTTYTVVS